METYKYVHAVEAQYKLYLFKNAHQVQQALFINNESVFGHEDF